MTLKRFGFCLLLLTVITYGCATTTPPPEDPQAYKNRSTSNSQTDVTVTVALPTMAEAEAIYGVDLASHYIQPVWVEITNRGTSPYWLLFSGLDPNYLFPSEAAFAFHGNSKDANHRIDEKFQRLQFRNPVMPGATVSGFVLSGLDEGFKAVDIDIVSQHHVRNFSFIVTDPDFKADFKMVDFKALYTSDEIIDVQDEIVLREMIESLPCCTTNADGDRYGDPINLVLIGETKDSIPALVRRNWHATEIIWSRAIMRTINSFLQGERYRYSPISPLYVYGRNQDIGWQKARNTISKRNHMRFWLSPIRFQGKPVFVGQISRDIGVKFTLKSPTISTHVIDPDVDEARRYFVEDLAYSQALAKIGYAKGVGTVSKEAPKTNLVGDPYYTDGLRAVLFFESRPYDLSEIEMLDWETPSAHLEIRGDPQQ